MATPIIQSDQPTGAGEGTAGEGRNDLEIGEEVELSDEADNAGHDYLWELLDTPIGSAAALADEDTPTPTFTPDVTGSYAVRCSVSVGGVIVGRAIEILAVPLPSTGARIPAFGEGTEYDEGGNAKGWHRALTEFMRAVDDRLEVELLAAYRSTSQANLSVGDAVIFNTLITSAGGLILNTSTGKISGLKAGRRYLLLAAVSINHSAAGRLQFTFRDNTAGAQIGRGWNVRTTTSASHDGGGSIGFAHFAPSVDSEIEVRMTNESTASIDIPSDGGLTHIFVCRIG